jgi:integrase
LGFGSRPCTDVVTDAPTPTSCVHDEIRKPIDPSNLRREFAKLTRKAGIGHWHPHELRHSAASLLSTAGVPIEQISDVLGHEGPRTTAAVYCGWSPPPARG